ncbi:ATP synthase F1 subunit delta [Acidocella sp.]|uniref:ATP synthase F1 subunit delta n=1 Tax=Acidocella sp. TaxID=50710 RepID=UPI002615B5A2|nr:ATP synthase F1 subunit delta [Acidocella sp.]
MGEITGTGETGLSARYAAALYALAFEKNALNEVVEQMEALGRLIAESPALAALLANPLTNSKTAAPALNEALNAQGFGVLVRNFVQVAVANRRLRDLPALIAGFAAYVARKRGEVVADVTTATPLTDLQRAQLHARLAEAGYGSVRLTERTDPAILGGMVLKIGSKLFDTSLKSRLNRLNFSLKGAA